MPVIKCFILPCDFETEAFALVVVAALLTTPVSNAVHTDLAKIERVKPPVQVRTSPISSLGGKMYAEATKVTGKGLVI